MVRIAHISDSHLGAALFQLEERREDVRKCFKKAVEMAIRQSPDILVHTGDLFDNPDPSPKDLKLVFTMFKKLQEKEILAVVLQGNHDLTGRLFISSPIQYLEKAGLAITTGESDYLNKVVTIDGQKVDLHLISWTREKRTRYLIASAMPKSKICLLFSHELPRPWDDVPSHYAYAGCGHAHNFRLDEELNIGRPGSTCLVNWRREIGQGQSRKLIVADISRDGTVEYTTEKLNDVREFKILRGINITGMSQDAANEILKKALHRLAPKTSQPIIVLEVGGTIDRETEAAIKRGDIIQYGEKILNPLILVIEPKWTTLGPRPVTLSKPLDVEQSITEYASFSGVDADEMLQLYREIIGGG